MPTVAACIAGASLIPSPTNTVLARSDSAQTSSTFSSGVLAPYAIRIPIFSARERTSASRSPETSMTRVTRWRGERCERNTRLSDRGKSSNPNNAANFPSRNTRHSRPASMGGNCSLSADTLPRPVTNTSRPLAVPRKPSPGGSLTSETGKMLTSRCLAYSVMAVARGCLE